MARNVPTFWLAALVITGTIASGRDTSSAPARDPADASTSTTSTTVRGAPLPPSGIDRIPERMPNEEP